MNLHVSGAGGVGIRAFTSGTADVSASVDVSHSAGGAALVAGTPAATTHRGALTSVSTTAPVVDLSNGGGTTFTNLGTLQALDVTRPAVLGSAGLDTVNLAGGSVTGVIAAGDGSDTVNWTAGQLAGSIEMGAADDALLLQGVDLSSVYRVDGGGGTQDRLMLAGIQYRGGSFGADDLAKGVNLGQDWETIDLLDGTAFTLTDDVVLSASTVNLYPGSTLLAGAGVHPVIRDVAGGPVTVNNAGTIDLSNGGTGPTDTLTIAGDYVGQNGLLRLETLVNEGGPNSTSDRLLTQTSLIGSGPTGIDVLGSGSGALTVGDGILLVDVAGVSAPGAFVLASRVVGGPYE